MKPYLHSKISSKRYGGKPEDYQDIHDFMDSTKACLPDIRHRALLHSSFGCYLVEKIYGITRTNSDGKMYSPRDVAEDRIQDDLGFIPTLERWFKNMPIEDWMSGTFKKTRKISFHD